jgi:hypothetical protein
VAAWTVLSIVALLERKQMPQQPELWIGVVEARPLDREAYGAAGAFTHIITWARSAAEFRQKADTILATLNLYVVGIEEEGQLALWLETQTPSVSKLLVEVPVSVPPLKPKSGLNGPPSIVGSK